MSMDDTNNFLTLVVVLITLFIGGAIVIVGGNSISSTIYSSYFNSTANVSTSLGHSIQSVNSVYRLTSNSSTNSTPLPTYPSNHSVLLNSPSGLSSVLQIVHEPNIGSLNIGVYVNGINVGVLGNGSTENFSINQQLTSSTLVEYR